MKKKSKKYVRFNHGSHNLAFAYNNIFALIKWYYCRFMLGNIFKITLMSNTAQLTTYTQIVAQMISVNNLHFSLVLANFRFSRYELSYPCELHRDLEKPLAKLKRKYVCHVGFQHRVFIIKILSNKLIYLLIMLPAVCFFSGKSETMLISLFMYKDSNNLNFPVIL